LVHVAVDLAAITMLLKALGQFAHRGLAVAEDDRGGDVFGFSRCRSDLALLARINRTLCWAMLTLFDAGRATSIYLGLLRNLSASFLIGGGIVAENSSVWRLAGSLVQIFSISG
jgi:hypothetical protein